MKIQNNSPQIIEGAQPETLADLAEEPSVTKVSAVARASTLNAPHTELPCTRIIPRPDIIQSLPADVMAYIFSYLGQKQNRSDIEKSDAAHPLLTLRAVCSHWDSMVSYQINNFLDEEIQAIRFDNPNIIRAFFCYLIPGVKIDGSRLDIDPSLLTMTIRLTSYFLRYRPNLVRDALYRGFTTHILQTLLYLVIAVQNTPEFRPSVDAERLFLNQGISTFMPNASEEYRHDLELAFLRHNNGTAPLCELVSHSSMSNNKSIAIVALKEGAITFAQLSDRLKNDREVVLAAIEQNPNYFPHVPDHLRDDLEVASLAIKLSPRNFRHASLRVRSDKQLVLDAIKRNPDNFPHVPDHLRDDEEVVLLRNDEEIALNAIKRYPFYIKDISDHLRNNKDFILKALKRIMQLAPGHFFEVSFNRNCLCQLSDRLKNDKEVVLAAIKLDSKNFQYASDRLKGDEEVVLAALQSDPFNIQYASDDLKDNHSFLLKAMQCPMDALPFESPERIKMMLRHASPRLQNNKTFVLRVAEKMFGCKWILKYTPFLSQQDISKIAQSIIRGYRPSEMEKLSTLKLAVMSLCMKLVHSVSSPLNTLGQQLG